MAYDIHECQVSIAENHFKFMNLKKYFLRDFRNKEIHNSPVFYI